MRGLPTTFLAAALVTLVAGCSSPSSLPSLPDVFHNDLSATNGTVATVQGAHVEAAIGQGAWGTTGNVTVEAGKVAGPAMGAPSPTGGGGDKTALPAANASATVRVRLAEAASLAGYTARYWVLQGGNMTLSGAPTGTAPANEEYTFTLQQPGPFAVAAALADGNKEVARFATPFTGSLGLHWSITGVVQPEGAQSVGGAVPWPTPREQMVDAYTVDLPEGATVTATTAFDGTAAPTDGADVDLGLYGPDGTGLICSAGALGSGNPADPSNAGETFTAQTTASGAWSIQVGAMADGCPTNGSAGSFDYANAGPVPYTLDLTVG